MNNLVSDRISDSLPRWVIERAAAYMLSRYGRAAMMRAATRHHTLLDQGEHQAAADWLRVIEEIERIGTPQIHWPRGRVRSRPDVPPSGP